MLTGENPGSKDKKYLDRGKGPTNKETLF